MPGLPVPEVEAHDAVFQIQDPRYFQPPTGQTIRLQGNSPAQNAAAGEVELASVQLQGGTMGVFRIVQASVTNLLATSNIIFRIKVGGHTVEGWEFSPFPVPAAVFALEFPPDSTLIELGVNTRASITGTVLDAGLYDLAAMVQGWRFGREVMDEFLDAYRGAT